MTEWHLMGDKAKCQSSGLALSALEPHATYQSGAGMRLLLLTTSLLNGNTIICTETGVSYSLSRESIKKLSQPPLDFSREQSGMSNLPLFEKCYTVFEALAVNGDSKIKELASMVKWLNKKLTTTDAIKNKIRDDLDKWLGVLGVFRDKKQYLFDLEKILLEAFFKSESTTLRFNNICSYLNEKSFSSHGRTDFADIKFVLEHRREQAFEISTPTYSYIKFVRGWIGCLCREDVDCRHKTAKMKFNAYCDHCGDKHSNRLQLQAHMKSHIKQNMKVYITFGDAQRQFVVTQVFNHKWLIPNSKGVRRILLL